MFYTRVIPVIVLLAWMPLPSAHAEGEGAGAQAGVVSFKTTLGTISRLYRQLDYEQALDLIQLARQRPLGPSELVTLSLYEGIILYDMGKQVESGDAFQMALLMNEEAKLPEQVSPKIVSHFEAFRQRILQELASAAEPGMSGARPAPAGSRNCPPARIAAKGRNLKAQQLWRLASMDQMLCVRGLRDAKVAETLAALTTRVTEAGTGTEWMSLSQDINRLAHQYAVYPSNESWRQTKSSVPEELWDIGDEDQDVTLPESPIVAVVSSPSEEQPANLFGCRAAVAVECERLMRRLLLLQNQVPSLDAASRSAARKELFRLGKRIREASFSETLEEASDEIDAWPGKWSGTDAVAPVVTAPAR
jgi:hypothetical protein